MQLTCLSWHPQRPSLLLKWPSATVMLDCAIDTSALASFLPASLVQCTRLSSLPGFRPPDGGVSNQLLTCCEQVFVDALPEVHPPEFYATAVESIDVVLVSNWMSMIALPFITERPDFRGVVYATDPTVQLGRLVMEELLEFVERINRDKSDDKWKEKEMWKWFPNQPSTDPKQWSRLYTTEQMNSCLSKVKLIAYRETVNIHGVLSVSAFSSGFSIGSANWTIQTDYEKVG
uniref:Metallo-beta-lactamase domain-containing protein n=1 Tax=Plectus sambesii TaxID=2011161 RepID=A0A914V6P2_9BILA